MRKLSIRGFAVVTTIAVVFIFALPAMAESTGETIYKAKCAGCHGPDGSGSAIGKKLGARDFHSADVQKQSDADLTGAITNGKDKMPAYGKTLKAEDIKSLVAYIRSLAPAK